MSIPLFHKGRKKEQMSQRLLTSIVMESHLNSKATDEAQKPDTSLRSAFSHSLNILLTSWEQDHYTGATWNLHWPHISFLLSLPSSPTLQRFLQLHR